MHLDALWDITLYEVYVWVLRLLISIAVSISVVVSISRLSQCFKYVYYSGKARFYKRPEEYFAFATLPDELRGDDSQFPMVAVQLPMFNEREVCQAIIECACELRWPRGRLIVQVQNFGASRPPARIQVDLRRVGAPQVLDDSTDRFTANLVDEKVAEWRARGINCVRLRRSNRQGYKAGALKDGLLELCDVEYVAIFDADFKPEPDFLRKTIPYLMANPTVGYVQTCWTFLNPDESYLTKAQEISLNYHFLCEQYTYFASGAFFNFNGTAGVWRSKCIADVGGWNARTTVEDMDLSLRAYLGNWGAIFLKNVHCLNELPASFFAYRKQQHRWTCGPVALWRKATPSIFRSKIPLLRKLELFVVIFGIHKFACHWVNFGFYCTLVPLSIFTPEVNIPLWVLVHLPVAVTLTTAMFTPKGWMHALLYILFENAMGVVKTGAAVAGMLDLRRAQEWVVTTKLGSSDSRPGTGKPDIRSCKLYTAEALMSVFVLSAALYGILSINRLTFSVFLVLQALAFMAFGLNLVDCNSLLGDFWGVPFFSRSTSKADKKATEN